MDSFIGAVVGSEWTGRKALSKCFFWKRDTAMRWQQPTIHAARD